MVYNFSEERLAQNMKCYVDYRMAVLVLSVLVLPEARAQSTIFGTADYQNLWYVPQPGLPQVDGPLSPRALSFYSGHVSAATASDTPRSGNVYLVQSAIGFPIAPTPRADFVTFGSEITPPEGCDPAIPPTWDPKPNLFAIPNSTQLVASDLGYVTVSWAMRDGTSKSRSFFVSPEPASTPVVLFHTHNSGINFTNPPPVPPDGMARRVVLPSQQVTIEWKWNTAIPFDAANPAVTNNAAGELLAHGVEGLICAVIRENGSFAGFEIVSVRPPIPQKKDTPVDIGSRFLPTTLYSNSVAEVSRGLHLTDPNLSFVYQHNVEGSTQYREVFAIRKSLAADGADIELLWRRRSFGDIDWTYELNRHRADWPSDVGKYQRYIRGSTAVSGPDVEIHPSLNFDVMPYRDPASTHTAVKSGNSFTATGAGWSLLRYLPGDRSVRFRVIRSVRHNDAALLGDLSGRPWAIGSEITDEGHQGNRPGYIHVPEGNRYDWETYDDAEGKGSDWEPEWTTRQIFAVNTGTLEVWWSTVDVDGIQWPSYVRRYHAVWPEQPEHIVIASTEGSGPINETQQRNIRLYIQNDANRAGFNPNDEHALLLNANRLDGQLVDGRSVFALRDDLGTPESSLPYVLLKYRDPASRWQFRVFQVVAEDDRHRFDYPATAGALLQPPYPLSLLQLPRETYGVSGPWFKDRKAAFWARAAGTDDGPTNIVLRHYYPIQPGFYFPTESFVHFPPSVVQTNLPPAGIPFAWLNQRPGAPLGEPTDILYEVRWPTNFSALNVGETLVTAKKGLPNIKDQTSVEVLYDQGLARNGETNFYLIDPLREITISNVDLSSASDLETEVDRGVTRFVQLPPHLRSRIGYRPDLKRLEFAGEFVQPTGGESYLLLNVLSAREAEVLGGLSSAGVWQRAVAELQAAASQVIQVMPNTPFAGLALTAGKARSAGWMTLAFGNSTNLSPAAEPVALSVFRVECPRYVGEVKVIESDGPLDEKLTLRHSGDFAGRADQYEFEWRTLPSSDVGGNPTGPYENWNLYAPKVAAGLQPGQGAVDLTIEGAGLFTLSDNYFVCRYRPLTPDGVCAPWSDWTKPQPAPGWIKRALTAINPFDQRLAQYADHGVDTIVSMIAQAGTRYRGSIPFNKESLPKFGLLEIYESILKRGISFSIEGAPPVNYGPANDALLLAAGRISDLYSLLGNEAYADAADPTIAFGTEGQYGAEATSIHCFMNQTASLIEEELALLRGRDDRLQPSVTTFPFYSRMIWNFTSQDGEVAYVQNYNIRDQNADGKVDEADARALYPQGHGDAWGHYLSAIKGYYQLLRHPHFAWVPRAEAVLVGGVPVSVDFFDERKFARAAAAKARTGAEIVALTYRANYTDDPSQQWQGYADADRERAWGTSEWGSRAGMGAYFDWVTGNAVLPSSSSKTGIEKIDRSTVIDLREIAAVGDEIQTQVDKADQGLNPLGLSRNVVPFGIEPSLVVNPQGGVNKTHFEQIYDRAVTTMNNAIAVFNHANNSSQLLRRQADSLIEFQKQYRDRESDLTSRLIEVFGYPYPDDIGAGKTYPQGYDGPDLDHYYYSDPSVLLGQTNYSTQTFILRVSDISSSSQGEVNTTVKEVTCHISSEGFGMVRPPEWRGQRRAPGEIQRSHGELLQAKGRFDRAQRDYDNLLAQIEDSMALLRAQHQFNSDEIYLLNTNKNTQESLSKTIRRARESQLEFQTKGRMAGIVANAVSEGLPKSFGIIAGLAAGVIADYTSGIRSAIQLAGTAITEMATREANRESLVELDQQQAKEVASAANNIELTVARQNNALRQQIKQLEQLVRQEALLRLELYSTQEAMAQAAGAYQATLARGQRLLEDRIRFRLESGAEIQTRRYNDMTFRVFRNEALQKYRAQFDMAALYVFLAARAYDFETNLRLDDSAHPGKDIMRQIVQARTIGLISSGIPQTGVRGDSGLADPMARMSANFQLNLRPQLGLNNPQFARRDFSLRSQFFRILPTNGAAHAAQVWRDTLARHVVPSITEIPEFRRHAIFQATQAREPGIVIPFSTIIDQDLNFFGWPAGAGDSSYNPSSFATKIRSSGLSFSNYKVSGTGGMRETVFVYLIPLGNDIMRSPRRTVSDEINYTRSWQVEDQWLPTPFRLNDRSDPRLNLASYIPLFSVEGANQLADVRALTSFQAFHDSLNASRDEPQFQDSQLVGRSVWNTRWLLVIPGSSLSSDRHEGIQRFIYGGLVNGVRSNDGVTDIRLQFQTYSYTGR